MEPFIPKENNVYCDLWADVYYIFDGQRWIKEENADETQKAMIGLWKNA